MNRAWLKQNAKAVLKKNYFILLIISFVVAIAGGVSGGINYKFGDSDRYDDISYEFREFTEDAHEFRGFDEAELVVEEGLNFLDRSISNLPGGNILLVLFGLGIGLLSVAVVILGASLFNTFITFPVQVGGARAYIDCSEADNAPHIGRLAYAYGSGHFTNVAMAGFLRWLYTFLWTLLFVIPGIIKGYAYSMTPYILADNPGMKASDALRLSEEMMRGHKWEKFVLDWSFFGWFILGSLAFGIGVFFVQPYVDATVTQFYLQLRSGYLADSAPVDVRAPEGYTN